MTEYSEIEDHNRIDCSPSQEEDEGQECPAGLHPTAEPKNIAMPSKFAMDEESALPLDNNEIRAIFSKVTLEENGSYLQFAHAILRESMRRTALSAPSPEAPMNDAALHAVHLDDWWVDLFAKEMKAKLENARAKGRGGWQDCDPADLSRMLREHVEKGDPRDVANFCMFLWALRSPISAASDSKVTTLTTKQILTICKMYDVWADRDIELIYMAEALILASNNATAPSPDALTAWAVTTCAEGCQYSKDVGMWPEHSCASKCVYTESTDPITADELAALQSWLWRNARDKRPAGRVGLAAWALAALTTHLASGPEALTDYDINLLWHQAQYMSKNEWMPIAQAVFADRGSERTK